MQPHRPSSLVFLLTVLVIPFASFAQLPKSPGQERDLFNGKDLTGWEGDPQRWSVKDGAITGTFAATVPSASNASPPSESVAGERSLMWKEGPLSDYQLEFKYRLTPSKGDNTASAAFVIRGETGESDRAIYTQIAQFTGKDVSYYGELWEPRPHGRGTLAQPGGKVTLNEAALGKMNRNDLKTINRFAGYLHRDWNSFKVIAKANRIQTFINGHPLAELTDLTAGAILMGPIGFQLIQPGVVAQFKEVRLTDLAPAK